MDAALLIARCLLAAVFGLAAVAKVLDRPGTAGALRAFGVPERFVAPGALALPGAEALVALLLLVGTPVAVAVGGGAALGLLSAFSAAVVVLLRKGQAPTCHCFGNLTDARVGRPTLVRNAAFGTLALVVLVGGPGAGGRLLAPALTLLVVGAAAVVSARRAPGRVGSRAPRWTLPRQGGGELTLDDARAGGASVLVFVAPGCGPCTGLLADLPRWGEHLPVVVVSAGAAPDAPGVLVAEATDDAVARRYGVAATPTGVLVDDRGRVAAPAAAGAVEIEALVRSGAQPVFHTAAFEAHGVRFAIRSDSADGLVAARAALPAASSDVDNESAVRWTLLTAGGSAALYRGWELRGRDPVDRERIVAVLAADIRIHVAEFAPEHVFVHSGVVAWRDRVILVPGRSFTGKSTFVTALLRAGARYLSDEYAVIDRAGLVHPYAKPIALRDDGGYQSTDHPVGEFTDLAPQKTPLRIGAVVRAPFEAGTTWEPVPVSTGAGCMILMDNTVGIRAAPRRTLSTLTAAIKGATVLDAPRGEADAAARAVLAHLDVCFGYSAAQPTAF